MEFSRQEYWSGLSCPPSTDLPNPGIEPRSPVLQADSLPSEPPGKPSIGILMPDSRRGADRSDALEVRSSGWSGEAFVTYTLRRGDEGSTHVFRSPSPARELLGKWLSEAGFPGGGGGPARCRAGGEHSLEHISWGSLCSEQFLFSHL